MRAYASGLAEGKYTSCLIVCERRDVKLWFLGVELFDANELREAGNCLVGQIEEQEMFCFRGFSPVCAHFDPIAASVAMIFRHSEGLCWRLLFRWNNTKWILSKEQGCFSFPRNASAGDAIAHLASPLKLCSMRARPLEKKIEIQCVRSACTLLISPAEKYRRQEKRLVELSHELNVIMEKSKQMNVQLSKGKKEKHVTPTMPTFGPARPQEKSQSNSWLYALFIAMVGGLVAMKWFY